MFTFTASDKALLHRTARHLLAKANELERMYGQASWGTDKTTRAAKLEFDRLQRDARDLIAMGKRLAAFSGTIAATPPTEITNPAN